MYVDANTLLSDQQALTVTAHSTNTVKIGPVNAQPVGPGNNLKIPVTVNTAADFTTGDESYRFQVISSDNSDLSGASVLDDRTIAAATLVAGFRFVMSVSLANAKKYVGMNYVLGGTTPSITVSAFITDQAISEASTYAAAVTQPV